MGIEVGQVVPDLSLKLANGETRALSDYCGKKVILYFYPKDDTPGCTCEAEDFRDQHAQVTRQDAVVLGVSRDTVGSHQRFQQKLGLPFELVSDQDETLCQLFDVIKMKTMYGKPVRGIERSTFLIDAAGVLRQEWRKVKVEGHVEAVLSALGDL